MIALIQRVNHANVKVAGKTIGEIERGLLVLLGVEKSDNSDIAKKLADKMLKLRIFSDLQGKMNLNVEQAKGGLLIVSQFTLVADTSKGNRPGFSNAAPPELGKQLYHDFYDYCAAQSIDCAAGEFGADMQISLENDGPVTFHLQLN